ncbi:hypothetical protein F4778DRAFT_84382 [Xylariomycetidae sp. FL2044]|nr:hypothetical protein F4778DRAFT_84382 [Xylariomycetidae sp. FL2044]
MRGRSRLWDSLFVSPRSGGGSGSGGGGGGGSAGGDRPSDPADLPYRPQPQAGLVGSYRATCEAYVPLGSLADEPRIFIENIWQFDSITALCKALRAHAETEQGSVNWRLSGTTTTYPGDETKSTQTLEFRLMQGSLHGEHIRHWMSICHALVTFSRDADPGLFRATIAFLAQTVNSDVPANIEPVFTQALKLPAEVLNFFLLRVKPGGGFEYSNKDVVDWTDPFMTRGDGDMFT